MFRFEKSRFARLSLLAVCGACCAGVGAQTSPRAGIILSGSQHALLWREGSWQAQVEPLAAILMGDSIKVKQAVEAEVLFCLQGSRAPLKLKFGDRAYFVSAAQALAADTVSQARATTLSRGHMLWRSLVDAFIEDGEILLKRAATRSAPAMIISPRATYVLPQKQLRLEWRAEATREYGVRLRERKKDRIIFAQEKIAGPALLLEARQFKLRPGKSYEWSVMEGARDSASAVFTVAPDSLTKRIRRQLQAIAASFAGEEWRLPKLITEAAYLQSEGFFYDARGLLREALQQFPGQRELEKLLELSES